MSWTARMAGDWLFVHVRKEQMGLSKAARFSLKLHNIGWTLGATSNGEKPSSGPLYAEAECKLATAYTISVMYSSGAGSILRRESCTDPACA